MKKWDWSLIVCATAAIVAFVMAFIVMCANGCGKNQAASGELQTPAGWEVETQVVDGKTIMLVQPSEERQKALDILAQQREINALEYAAMMKQHREKKRAALVEEHKAELVRLKASVGGQASEVLQFEIEQLAKLIAYLESDEAVKP